MSIPDPIVLLDARARYVHPAFQMTRASTKTVFDATGKLVTVPVNALGWDHDPATGHARGYLAEPSATNLLLHSNDLTQEEWTKNRSTITPNAIIGPDGSGMGKLVEDDTEGLHRLRQTVSVSGDGPVVVSAIAKSGDLTHLWLRVLVDSGDINAVMDLSTASVTHSVPLDAGIEPLGGGFFRCWLVADVTGESTIEMEITLWRPDEPRPWTYLGDGTSGLYVGYCQVEEGSYPTSYIETGAATATRAADGLVLSGLADFPWWTSERGTLLLDFDAPVALTDTEVLSMSDPNGLRVRYYLNGSLIVAFGGNGSGTVLQPNDAVGRHAIAVTWGPDGWAVAADGAIRSTGQMLVPIGNTNLGLGTRPGASSRTAHTHIRRSTYLPAAVGQADLQSLTAIQE